MDAAEHWAGSRNCSLFTLRPQKTTLRRNAFMRREVIGKLTAIENYYSDGTAAWVMLKWLKANKAVEV